MKKFLAALLMMFVVACSEDTVKIPDNRGLIDANTALIELNSELDALLEARVTALEARVDAVEADITSINEELELLGEETEENAENIARLRYKLRKFKREQEFINRINKFKFRFLKDAVRDIERDIQRLYFKDYLLGKKIRNLADDLRDVRRDIYFNGVMDLFRFQIILGKLASVNQKIGELQANQFSVVECDDQVFIDTPEGLLGVALIGEEVDVLYEQGDFVEEYKYCDRYFLGFCIDWDTVPAHISEGETISIFVAEDAEFQLIEEPACGGN